MQATGDGPADAPFGSDAPGRGPARVPVPGPRPSRLSVIGRDSGVTSAAQRDAIARELGNLSGVIDALAVSDAPDATAAQTQDSAHPRSVVAEPDPSQGPHDGPQRPVPYGTLPRKTERARADPETPMMSTASRRPYSMRK